MSSLWPRRGGGGESEKGNENGGGGGGGGEVEVDLKEDLEELLRMRRSIEGN
jgi:hypothetical protein